MRISRARQQRQIFPVSVQWLPRLITLGLLASYLFFNPRVFNFNRSAGLTTADSPIAEQSMAENVDDQLMLISADVPLDSQATADAAVPPANESTVGPAPLVDAQPQPATELDTKPAAEFESEKSEPDTNAPAIDAKEQADRDAAQLADHLSLVRDGTLKIHPREMAAYWELMHLAATTKPQELWDEGRPFTTFHGLHQSPQEHRGELIRLELYVRRVVKYPISDPNADGITEVYEIWGWTNQSKAWMYCLLTPKLPAWLPVGDFINKRANFAGYFMKLQGYQPASAKPNAPALLAPLLIGRFSPLPLSGAAAQPVNFLNGWWVSGLIGVLILFVLWRARRLLSPRNPTISKSDTTKLRQVLELALPEPLPDSDSRQPVNQSRQP
jgi:hypothetical protein